MPFVLDASTALCLILPEELTTSTAKAVARAFSAGDVALVPSLWVLEVTNALLMTERRKRIALGAADALLANLLELPVRVAVDATPDGRRALELLSVAREHQLTAYDCAYLCLARSETLALASEDRALVRAAEAVGVRLVVG